MSSGISFGHFNIVGGDVREDGPYVAVIEDRAPAESLADLYLALEPVTPASSPLCPELIQLIERRFGLPQYSLTGNLLQSLRAAQEHLRAWNKSCGPEQRAAIGATCLAVSGGEGYLAQIGPGVTYARRRGRLQRFEAAEEEARLPLGATIGCSPDFYRLDLAQGDTLLLASSSLVELADDGTIDLILSLPPGEALPRIYRLVRRQRDFSALYLTVTGDLGEQARLAEAGEVWAEGDDPRATGSVRESAARPERNLDSGVQTSEQAADLLPRMPRSPLPRYSAHVQPLSARRRQLGRLQRRHAAPPRPALYTVAAIAVLILAGWLGLPRLLQSGRQDRFSALLRDAASRDQAAASASDPAVRRTLLEKAQADLEEAKTLRAQEPQLAALQDQTGKLVDTLNAVRPLPSSTPLLDLGKTQIVAGSVSDMVAGTQLYLLDSSTGKVFVAPLSGQPAQAHAIFESGKLIENVQAGRAQHLALQSAAQGQQLLYILDSNRRLFSYDGAGTLRSVGLNGANAWKSAVDFTVNGKNLYVLDTAANQVWHYTAGDGGFTAAPQPLLTKVDLHDAVQIAFSGDLWISTSSGKLLRVRDGRLQPLSLRGIDRPLVAPQPPVVDSATGLSYIADPGNQRIVVAGSDDTFRYQYVDASLHGLRMIALDSHTGVLYALSEGSVIAAGVK